MHRFRLLGFYVAGIVGMIGLTIGGVSMRRTADDHGVRQESGKETALRWPTPFPVHGSLADVEQNSNVRFIVHCDMQIAASDAHAGMTFGVPHLGCGRVP